jgi:hypothetical protein
MTVHAAGRRRLEVEFFDLLEAAQARLRQAMEAADARVKPWQAAVKVPNHLKTLPRLALAQAPDYCQACQLLGARPRLA